MKKDVIKKYLKNKEVTKNYNPLLDDIIHQHFPVENKPVIKEERINIDDIDWEQTDVFDYHDHGCEIHLEGEDKDGNRYSASGYKSQTGEIEIYIDSIDTIDTTEHDFLGGVFKKALKDLDELVDLGMEIVKKRKETNEN